MRENRTYGSIGGRWGGDHAPAEMSDEPSGLRSTPGDEPLNQWPTSPEAISAFTVSDRQRPPSTVLCHC